MIPEIITWLVLVMINQKIAKELLAEVSYCKIKSMKIKKTDNRQVLPFGISHGKISRSSQF